MQAFKIFKTFQTYNLLNFSSKQMFSEMKTMQMNYDPKIPISPKKLAQQLKIKQSQIRKQMSNPRAIKLNQQQIETISLLNGYKIRFNGQQVSQTEILQNRIQKKCPVITIMGHVDHGKTTLIDYLRNSNIADKQDGGITQRIGAFSIDMLKNGQKLTFIDTPGHQAFVNMRQRGANMTDLVVLIVSATQGVKKQTLQIIETLKKNNIKTIVAINKLDLPQANPQDVEQQLFKAGLSIEPHGGNIPVVHISAKSGKNIDLLCELINEQTAQLTADRGSLVQGSVLQACESSQGLNSCTLIIQKGTLKIGSLIIFGDELTRIKNMQDDLGNNVTQAYPGDAVQIIGIPIIPNAGDQIFEVQSEAKGKFILQKKNQVLQHQKIQRKKDGSITATKIKFSGKREKRKFAKGLTSVWDQKFKQAQDLILQKIQMLQNINPKTQEIEFQLQLALEELKNHKQYVYQYLQNNGTSKNIFNVLFKFSDRGIQQTILTQFSKIKTTIQKDLGFEVTLLKSEVGQVTLNDIQDAALLNAQIFTFGVGTKSEALPAIKQYNINPKMHKLIHNFLGDIKKTAENKKKSKISELKQKGRAQIAQVYRFKKGKSDNINVAGVQIINGKINKNYKLYVFRNGVPISQAALAKHIRVFKKDVIEVKKNEECTIILNDQSITFEKGDQLVAYQ